MLRSWVWVRDGGTRFSARESAAGSVPLICVLLNASVCSAALPPSEAGSVPARCAFSETSRVCSELIQVRLAGIVPDMWL